MYYTHRMLIDDYCDELCRRTNLHRQVGLSYFTDRNEDLYQEHPLPLPPPTSRQPLLSFPIISPLRSVSFFLVRF